MSIVNIKEKTIFGLSTRTNNKNEKDPKTGKIPGLVQEFDQKVSVNYRDGARVYSIYYDYESDVSGDYSVLIGADKVEPSNIDLQEIQIPAGEYLVFTGQGQIPQVVFETWLNVWKYFASENCPHTRAYTTDFEFYKSQHEIEIHIAIQ